MGYPIGTREIGSNLASKGIAKKKQAYTVKFNKNLYICIMLGKNNNIEMMYLLYMRTTTTTPWGVINLLH